MTADGAGDGAPDWVEKELGWVWEWADDGTGPGMGPRCGWGCS